MTLAIDGGTPVRTQPFPTWPVHDERETAALQAVLDSNVWWHSSQDLAPNADDPEVSEVSRFGAAFARAHDCRYGLPACNGTATLELILRALDIGPGDEVIVPAYSYIATATCVIAAGAVPRFVDIDPGSFNIDPERLGDALTPRTRAVIPVHFAGQSADMDGVNAFAERHGLAVVEDAAHAHGASWRGHKCGSLGTAGSFSFQASKNMTAGEGGMITTNDQALAERAASHIWCGREPGYPWYVHPRASGNYRMTEFQAALLQVQLSRLTEQTRQRDANGRYLAEQLAAQSRCLSPMSLDPRADRISFHLFMARYNAQACADWPSLRFLEALAAEGIPCSAGYGHGLYRNPCFINHTFWKGSFPCVPPFGEDVDYTAFAARCPVTEAYCQAAVWLPQNLLLGNRADMDDIVEAVCKVEQASQN